MSPVFRHGSLRLYLLRLLDEEPRHGYEVIRLLQDRFMGVYAPSPGTIYPRLARLEEEGLVTHDDSGGRKVYRLSRRGNRRLNHAIHMAAITQIRYRHTKGRAYYDKKLAEGKTGKEALRALKRQISDAIEFTLFDQPLNQRFRLAVECLTQHLDRRRRKDARQHRAGARMKRRIRLEDDARRPPRRFLAEIAQAHARPRAIGLPVGQGVAHLLMPGHRPDAVFLEPYRGPSLAQGFVVRIGIAEKVMRKRISGRNRSAQRCLIAHGVRSLFVIFRCFEGILQASLGIVTTSSFDLNAANPTTWRFPDGCARR